VASAVSEPLGVSAADPWRGEDRDVAALVVAAQQGDSVAFDRLVELTHRDTYTLALRLTGDPHEAADVTQEAYLRAYRSIDGFRAESRFSTWMYRITANCASTHMGRLRRHRRRNRELASDELVVDETGSHDPQARTDAAELHQQLLAALDGLPAKLRAVVVLRDSYDMSHEDIAQQLGISVAAAKVRLHRARRKIHETVFAEDSSQEPPDG
jgi:RNA polymerase sigma-70 factor (ECF subfamily)